MRRTAGNVAVARNCNEMVGNAHPTAFSETGASAIQFRRAGVYKYTRREASARKLRKNSALRPR
jgi:hypothetical protein